MTSSIIELREDDTVELKDGIPCEITPDICEFFLGLDKPSVEEKGTHTAPTVSK